MSKPEYNVIDELICPCEKQEEIIASEIGENLKCPKCKINLKQRAYLPFLEYLMENGYVQNLDFFDLDLYSEEKDSLYSQDEEQELDKYEVRKDSLNIYEDDARHGGNTVAAETETSIDESAVSSDWTKFATEDSE
ncbi:MAG: hypothetical protein CBC78_001440 [Candidatus Pelagibacter sp. TMED118]|jgi:hypothetical protein|nr:MAG: hypothetical protein CBC78_001440 [Candidatus Pelagibacter sp. TMED118]|tara:strand:+ start:3500 stop:3907 length:408 start_codon:yes stop_codon:yes gene_type:complete